MTTTKRSVSLALVAALAVQASGCGTILHPERRGQRGGRLDAGVVILDAIGLLFFIIPGVISFAVDFSNGTIYLPGGGRGVLSEIRFDKTGDAKAAVEAIILARTGQAVELGQPGMRIVALNSLDEMGVRFDLQRVYAAGRAPGKTRSF
ncbi:MAG: hypothetical protein A2506_02540 [Elusimicrobia bacterium RIFOXYD12_FULL_66_9]|nr:MAG: hypothetical protein A2506_02540 [Elusimicrobia bacterium RIFOXYD12_FULL_66_9]